MSVSWSEVDAQLDQLGEVPAKLDELVRRLGASGLTLPEVDDALSALREGLTLASIPTAVPTQTLTGLSPSSGPVHLDMPSVAPNLASETAGTAAEPASIQTTPAMTTKGTLLGRQPIVPPQLPDAQPAPSGYDPFPSSEASADSYDPFLEQTLAEQALAERARADVDFDPFADAEDSAPGGYDPFPSSAPVALDSTQERRSSIPPRSARRTRDTLRDEHSIPPPPFDPAFAGPAEGIPSSPAGSVDAFIDVVEDAAPREPADAFASASNPARPADEAMDVLFDGLERDPGALAQGEPDGTVTAVFDGHAEESSDVVRAAYSVPPPLSAHARKGVDETGDFELLFEDELLEIEDDEVEIVEEDAP